MIIDTNRRLNSRIDCLKSSNVATAVRYYARATSQPEKRLIRTEAEALVNAGISIAVVHQAGGASPDAFSSINGRKDAEHSFEYAIETIGQPGGAAIYFAVDFDCDAANYSSRVLPHFKAINMVATSGVYSRSYEIGAYGNGLVLSRLLDAGLCKYAWLSQSLGHHESRQFKASGRWTLAQKLPSSLCGIGVDVDDLNSAANSFGDFSSLQPITTALAAPVLVGRGSRFRTTASSGLRLREGPGIQFSVIRLLPPDTVVAILGTQDSWSIVDIDGDGLAEGAVASAFLGAL
ncbi:hypothetical protein LMG26684_04606 [Achromobacter mucicolens]|uniref:glycoside hydrolase domain-containing protein n=1 Tax=Achromobacter mucicolens TaxID=1389922 RepID=UPI0014670B43|nr:glycoside hydrolase domain-containing protein [Achromobacter mucicolens]CAB3901065.1 hypothetical protein LMG26684_04606 [Achromobacter mucicolens]